MRVGKHAAFAATSGARKRMGIGSAVALVLLGVAPIIYAQTTFTWTGGAPTSEIDGTTYSDLFTGWNPPANGSKWNAGLLGPKTNWRLPDGSIPNVIPGALDTVVFGDDFPSGNPISRENQAIHKLVVQTSSNFVMDFRDVDGGFKSLMVRSGEVTANTTVNGNFGFVGRMFIVSTDASNNPVPVDAVFDISGAKEFDFRGPLSASGSFTKRGNQTIHMASAEWTHTIAGDLIVEDGRIELYTPQIGGDIIVGDGVGAAESAKLMFTVAQFALGGQVGTPVPATRLLNDVTVKQDGYLWLFDNNYFSSLTLEGGSLRYRDANAYMTSLVAGPSSTGAAPIIGDGFYGDSKLDMSGAATGVIELTGAAASDTALDIYTRLFANNLVVKGTGILTFHSPDDPILNSIDTTTIESGTVRVNRTNDNKVLGTSITIGKTGETKPARLHLNNAVPFDSTTDVTVLQNGRFTVYNTTIDTLSFQGGGLVDSEGARNLTVNAATTSVTGTNATATLQPNRTTFAAASHSLDIASTNTLNINGAVTANGLTKTGAGTLRFSGAGADSISSLFVQSGTLELNRTPGQNFAPGTFTVGLLNVSGPTIKWLAGDQLPSNYSLTFNSGTLNLNGVIDAIGGFTASGTGTRSIETGAGTLGITGGVTVNQGALVSTNGTVDLVVGTRNFSAGGNIVGLGGFTNLKFSGAINNGTFNKTGVGTVEFNNVSGSATLAMSNGKAVSTGSTQFGGLTGTAPLEVQSGIFAVSNASAQASTYSGTISGAGGFHKRGAGQLTLNGTSPNTFTGGTTVAAGTLILDMPYDAVGDTTIGTSAQVITLNDIQFYSTAKLNVIGELNLGGKLQSINTLTASSDNPNDRAFVHDGRILTTGAVTTKNATLENVALTVDAGGLAMESSTAIIRGSITGNSSVDGASALLVRTLGADVTSLKFFNNLTLGNGTNLFFLLPNTPNAIPLLDVDGTLSLGASDAVATIDLSIGNFDLSEGKYALLQFGGLTPQSSPTLDNFTLIPATGKQGELLIENNTLYYVAAVPEPASLGVLMGAGALLMRRRRAH